MLGLIWTILISSWTCLLAPGSAHGVTVTLAFDLGPGASANAPRVATRRSSGSAVRFTAYRTTDAQPDRPNLNVLV
jgi:hypothetical protein